MNHKIQNLTPEAFNKYGTILRFTSKMNDGWEILVTSDNPGWRLALLEFSRKTTHQLEYHPTSKESFEPLSGLSLLIVAEHETPQDYEVFLLDEPICLEAGVWHQVISLSATAMVKITENLDVESVYYEVDHEIEVVVY
ncbi:MAG: hypothetical protein H7X94_07440 [Vallitaleaceae bacterium]|nr:hypothetical protein [Vallitaleaceae bacterium]